MLTIICNQESANADTFVTNVPIPAFKEPRHLSFTKAAKRTADAVDIKVKICGRNQRGTGKVEFPGSGSHLHHLD